MAEVAVVSREVPDGEWKDVDKKWRKIQSLSHSKWIIQHVVPQQEVLQKAEEERSKQ